MYHTLKWFNRFLILLITLIAGILLLNFLCPSIISPFWARFALTDSQLTSICAILDAALIVLFQIFSHLDSKQFHYNFSIMRNALEFEGYRRYPIGNNEGVYAYSYGQETETKFIIEIESEGNITSEVFLPLGIEANIDAEGDKLEVSNLLVYAVWGNQRIVEKKAHIVLPITSNFHEGKSCLIRIVFFCDHTMEEKLLNCKYYLSFALTLFAEGKKKDKQYVLLDIRNADGTCDILQQITRHGWKNYIKELQKFYPDYINANVQPYR